MLQVHLDLLDVQGVAGGHVYVLLVVSVVVAVVVVAVILNVNLLFHS
jgi:hypothetical protein